MNDIRIDGDLDALHSGNASIPFTVEFTNPKHQGLNAIFRIRHMVTVHDSDPENAARVAFEQPFVVTNRRHKVDVPLGDFPRFGYHGPKIDIACQAEVVVDDAIFFDSKNNWDVTLKRLELSDDGLASNPSEELSPRDEINFFRNFMVISWRQKLAWIAAFATFVLAMIGNFVLALFDTFIASNPIVYSNEVDIGLFGAGIGAVFGGKAFAAINKAILRTYKIAKLVKNPPTIVKGKRYRLSDFLEAKSSTNLQDVTLRLIVANLECGQYWRGSGTDRSRVTFSHPSRAVVLFEKTTAVIFKRADIETYFNDRFDLDKAFECLTPESMISETHGVKFVAMIQIMVGDLADTYLELPWSLWNREDFADHEAQGDDA